MRKGAMIYLAIGFGNVTLNYETNDSTKKIGNN